MYWLFKIIWINYVINIETIEHSTSFPLSRFLNINDKNILTKYREDLLCNPGIPVYWVPPGMRDCCKCDRDCIRFQDCCVDALWQPGESIKSYKSRLLNGTKYSKKVRCEAAFPYGVRVGYQSISYLMVASCPDSASDDEQRMCASGSALASSIPVIGADKYLYKNLYCAKCHQIEEFKFVRIRHYCHTPNVSNYIGCELKIHDDDLNPRYYSRPYFQITRQCTNIFNNTWHYDNATCARDNPYRKLCEAFRGPMGGFANYYCYLCNASAHATTPSVTYRECYIPAKPPPRFNWLSLLTFIDDSEVKVNNDITCKTNNLYDKLSKQCVAFVCPLGYRSIDGKCRKISKTFPSVKVVIASANFDKCLMSRSPKLFLIDAQYPERTIDVVNNNFGIITPFVDMSLYDDEERTVYKIMNAFGK